MASNLDLKPEFSDSSDACSLGDKRPSAEVSNLVPAESIRVGCTEISRFAEATPNLVPNSATRRRKYSPYAVDWRFLPEDVLLVKDYARYHLANGSNRIAGISALSPVWVNTIGRGPLAAVRSAKVLFIHIPKTGGTSISKLLYGKNLPHYTAEFWISTFGEAVTNFPTFSVVRHPVERLVSAYKAMLSGGTDIMAYSRYWRARMRGLESLESFVDHIYENRSRMETFPADLHEQAVFVVDRDGRVIVDRLFSLDSENGMPPTLERWLSVDSIPHLNATPPRVFKISDEVQNKIRSIYRRDFIIYNNLLEQGGWTDMKGRTFTPIHSL